MDPILIVCHASSKGHLDPVIIGVRHNDLFLEAETESMRRVELALARAELAKLATDLHRVERPATRRSD